MHSSSSLGTQLYVEEELRAPIGKRGRRKDPSTSNRLLLLLPLCTTRSLAPDFSPFFGLEVFCKINRPAGTRSK